MNIKVRKKILSQTIFLAVGCCVLRYLQRKNELLPDGSLIEGAYLHTVLMLVSICAALGSAFLLWKLAKHTSWEQFFHNKILLTVLFGGAGILLIGNVLLWIRGAEATSLYGSTSPDFSNFLNKLLPPLGIAAAGCIGFYAYKCYLNEKPSPLLYMCASLYLIVRLIVCFQAWNTDPSIHDYCYALLAAISTMLATFHLAGFSFDKGKRRMTLFWLKCAVHFCFISLADAIYAADLGELLITASLLLIMAVNTSQLLFAKEE